jgi:hypothetical protein
MTKELNITPQPTSEQMAAIVAAIHQYQQTQQKKTSDHREQLSVWPYKTSLNPSKTWASSAKNW